MRILNKISLIKYRCKLLLSVVVYLIFINTNVLKAQDPIFSLFESTAMNFNPSHVGNEDYSRVAIGYRNQYPTYKSPFVTYMASYDLYIEPAKSGLGLMIMNDKVGNGAFNTTSVSVAYSYNLQLSSDLRMRGGLSLSYISRKRDPNGLIFPDMPYFNGNIAYPAGYPVISNNTIYVGFGATLLYKRFKTGAALFNLGGQQLSESSVISLPNPVKVTAYMSVDIPLIQRYNKRALKEDVLVMSPYIRYIKQYGFDDVDIGAYFDFDMFFVGLAHRSDTGFKNSTFVIGTGLRTKLFNIGYSANFGNIGRDSRYFSAHEISVVLKLKNVKGESMLQGIYRNNEPSYYQRSRSYKCPY